jgi:alanyl-tRNA synthetase
VRRPESRIQWSFAAARTVNRTGEIGLVTVVREAAVASGVRRVEALTGTEARQYS